MPDPATRAEPSYVSLLGLVRHMAEVERGWSQTGGHADLLRERIDGAVGD